MDLLWQQPRRNTLVSWQDDVDQRVDILVRTAAAAGEQTSRSQIMAALVATTETRPEAMAALLHAYGRLASDALCGQRNAPTCPPSVPSHPATIIAVIGQLGYVGVDFGQRRGQHPSCTVTDAISSIR
jgi:hypothetical protein